MPSRYLDPANMELFKQHVRRELIDANARALELMPVSYRRRTGRCVGCGCKLDEWTKACRNCDARHYMRASNARKRERVRAEAAGDVPLEGLRGVDVDRGGGVAGPGGVERRAA